MPKTSLDNDFFDQDWEPVLLKGGFAGQAVSHTPTFGSQLTEARRLAQTTQHRLAQSIGVPLATVEAWEDDKRIPTKAQIVRLNRVLRCDKKLKYDSAVSCP